MTIGHALAHRPPRRSLPIDPKNPFGIVDGKATLWITREKQCLPIVDMADGHIINTINMLERKLAALREQADDAWGFAAGCRGEMASYYGGHMADDAMSLSLVYEIAMRPILNGLRAVAQSRGLVEVLVPFNDETRWVRGYR